MGNDTSSWRPECHSGLPRGSVLALVHDTHTRRRSQRSALSAIDELLVHVLSPSNFLIPNQQCQNAESVVPK